IEAQSYGNHLPIGRATSDLGFLMRRELHLNCIRAEQFLANSLKNSTRLAIGNRLSLRSKRHAKNCGVNRQNFLSGATLHRIWLRILRRYSDKERPRFNRFYPDFASCRGRAVQSRTCIASSNGWWSKERLFRI